MGSVYAQDLQQGHKNALENTVLLFIAIVYTIIYNKLHMQYLLKPNGLMFK